MSPTQVRLSRTLIGEAATEAYAPLVTLVEESRTAGGFEQASGPFLSYRRTLTPPLEALPGAPVLEEIDFAFSMPGLAWLVRPLFRRYLTSAKRTVRHPIWAPPTQLSAESLRAIGVLLWLSVLVAYASTLLGQTITYTAANLHATSLSQGVVLGVSRADVLIALPLAAYADRLGRRRIILTSLVLSCIFTALGGLAASMAQLAVAQLLGKGFATAATILITVVCAESVPKSARAFSVAVLIVGTAIGAGLCAALVSTFTASIAAWRLLYILTLLGLPLIWVLRNAIPMGIPTPVAINRPVARLTSKAHRWRLFLICLAPVLVNFFFIPASQFRNSFLRQDVHFNPVSISLFTIFSNLPGAIGLALGGRLAETKGRRVVGTVGLIGGSILFAITFLSSGLALWGFASAGAIVGTAASPTLGVFGPELFPSAIRARANAWATVAGRASSALGILLVGWAAPKIGGYGHALAILTVAPLLLGLLLFPLYPETKGMSLEEISPSI